MGLDTTGSNAGKAIRSFTGNRAKKEFLVVEDEPMSLASAISAVLSAQNIHKDYLDEALHTIINTEAEEIKSYLLGRS